MIAPMTTISLQDRVIKRTLPNGLTVLLKEDPTSPIVAVNVWFGVGSVHETEAEGGLAHFQEHMVFKGTEKHGVGEIANLIKGMGGNLNAGTSFSYTMYYVVVPARAFATALEVQADAMMRSTFDAGEFQKERAVVIDEARMYDDRPESFTFYRTMELAFTRHTYRRPIAGYEPVVEKITREQLLDFYRRYYTPANAALVVVGDVEPEAALARIEDAYGAWEPRPVGPGEPPVEPPQEDFRFKAYTGTMDHGYLGAGFHVPNILHDDYPALEMLSELLSAGRSSRLYRRVREEKRLVTSVSADMLAERWPGIFLVMASMPPEKWAPARDAIFEEVERFKREPVDATELEKARRQLERHLYREMETVEGQASNMGYYQLLGDYRLADHHREAIAAVTAERVMKVARRYFHPGNVSLVSYMPEQGGATPDPGEVRAAMTRVLSSEGGVTDMRSPDPNGVAAPADTAAPAAARAHAEGAGAVERFELDNGVRVLVKRRAHVPLVSVLTAFQGGGRFEPRGKSGLATLAHRALVKGTRTMTADQVSERIEGLGGSIDSFANFDSGGLYVSVLSEHLAPALAIYREVLREPALAAEQVDKEKQKLLEELSHRRDNPIHLAMDQMYRRVFGEHPYAYPFFGEAAEAAGLSGEDSVNWYRSLLVPASAVVAVVGDIETAQARDIAETLLGDLPGAPVRTPEFPAPGAPAAPGEHVVRRKELRQAITFVGFTAPRMMSDESVALQVLNGVLTGLGGRLFVELRDKRSLGYMTGSAYTPLFERSLFFGYANPGAEGIDEAVRVILAELEKVARAPVTDAELARAKEWLIGSQVMQLQRNSSQASAYGTYEALGFGYEAVDRIPERIQRVTPDDIMRVAAEVFHPEQAVIVKLLPEA